MAPLKSILAGALLAALPLASAAPQLNLDLNLGGGDSNGDGKTDMDDVMEDIGDAVEGIVSSVASILSNPDAKNMIPNRYIVVYNETYEEDAIEANVAKFTTAVKKRNLNKLTQKMSMRSFNTTLGTWNFLFALRMHKP